MRKLAVILALGVSAAVPLVASEGAAAQSTACPKQPPGQPTYLPNLASTTADAVIQAATGATISSDGQVKLTFNSSICGTFRLVLKAKEIRPGNKGYPQHNGYTTLANFLATNLKAGPIILNFTLSQRGLALLNYARSHGQSLTVFVIAHVRPTSSQTSSEAIQIVTVK